MIWDELKSVAKLALLAGFVLTAVTVEAKKKKPDPVPPPPPAAPAPKIVYVPYPPTPPNYAASTMGIPPLGADGLRVSVNRGISPAQTTWNFRSAYNVGALSCSDPKHAEIVVSYRAFLKVHNKTLALVNRKVDAEWRGKYGAKFIKPREKYMTEVYNHFASPPTLPAFCDAILAVSKDAKLIKKPATLDGFASASLPSVEIVFDDFFKRFDAYRVDYAAWEAKWGKGAVGGSAIVLPPGS